MGRREKKYNFIYKTTNLLSGKYYIGMHSTDDLNDGYMGSGRRLRYSLNKYGKENHKVEVLEFVNSRRELIKREERIVNLNEVAKEDCINLRVGGQGGLMDDDHKIKLMEGASRYQKEKWTDKSHVDKMVKLAVEGVKRGHKLGNYKYDTFTNQKHTEETKKKMSEKAKQRTGKKNSQYGTCWITKDGENKKIKKEDLNTHISNGWVRGRK